MSVIGNIAVSNSCGPLGQTHANPTPVAVQAITTASYASWPSECRPQNHYVDAVIDTLDYADIACPTWGLSDPFLTTCDGSAYLTATEGPPYNPVILVPTEFLDYDPAWGKCSQIATNGPFLMPCGVYDPPRTLSAQGGMITDPAAVSKASGVLTAMPGLVPDPQKQQPTALPDQQGASSQAPASPQDAPASQPPQPAPTSGPAPPQTPGIQDPGYPDQYASGRQNLAPVTLKSGQALTDPNPTGSSDPPIDPQKAVEPKPEPQPIPQTTINIGGQGSGGIGSIVNSAFGANPSPAAPQNAGGQGGNGGANPGGNGKPGGNSNPGGNGSPENPGGNPGNPAGSPALFTPHAITALGASLSAINPSAVAIGGKTLSAEGPAFTSNGNYYSVGPSGNLVAGTLAPAATPAPAALTLGGRTYEANPAGQIVVAGQTLTPGGPAITVSGTPISEAPGGAFAVVGGSTQSLITPAPSQGPALLTFGGSTYTADANSQFVVGGQTLTPGGQITVSGTALSEGAAGSGIVVVGGSSTQLLGHGGAALMTSAAVMTFGDQTITANSAGNFVVDGQTLTPGGVITVSGTPISEGTGAGNVVFGSSTEILSSVGMMVTSAAVMTFDGQTYTADAQGDFTIDGQTLTPGGVINVSGTPVSEGQGATDVVIGTSTEVLSTAAVTQSAMAFEGSGSKIQGVSFVKIIALAGGLVWFGA